MQKGICNYRKFAGYTQKDMADILKISIQSYRNKEKGKTPFKDSEKIIIKDIINANGFPELNIDDIFFNNKVAKSIKIKEVK